MFLWLLLQLTACTVLLRKQCHKRSLDLQRYLGTRLTSSGSQVSVRVRGFPAEYCTAERCPMLSISAVSGFNVGADSWRIISTSTCESLIICMYCRRARKTKEHVNYFSLKKFILFFFGLQGHTLEKVHHFKKVVPMKRKIHNVLENKQFSVWSDNRNITTYLKKSWVSRELIGGRDKGSEFSRPACRVFFKLSDSSCDTGINKGKDQQV